MGLPGSTAWRSTPEQVNALVELVAACVAYDKSVMSTLN